MRAPRPSQMIFGAFFLAARDEAHDPIAMLRSDDWSHVGLGFHIGGSDFDGARRLD